MARRLGSDDVLERLAWLMATRGVPEHLRSDNGSEFTATTVRQWLEKIGTKTLYIEPGSPWENGYVESFNGKLRDELLNGEFFYSVREAQCSSSRGGGTTTRCVRTAPWATTHRPPRRGGPRRPRHRWGPAWGSTPLRCVPPHPAPQRRFH